MEKCNFLINDKTLRKSTIHFADNGATGHMTFIYLKQILHASAKINVTCYIKLWMGDLGGLTSQLTSSSFGRDVKLGVPCLDAACTVGLN